MHDIVVKLKGASRHPRIDNTCRVSVFDIAEAVDEIERLREALKDLLDVVPILPKDAKFIVGMEQRYNNALNKARSALQQKDSE